MEPEWLLLSGWPTNIQLYSCSSILVWNPGADVTHTVYDVHTVIRRWNVYKTITFHIVQMSDKLKEKKCVSEVLNHYKSSPPLMSAILPVSGTLLEQRTSLSTFKLISLFLLIKRHHSVVQPSRDVVSVKLHHFHPYQTLQWALKGVESY